MERFGATLRVAASHRASDRPRGDRGAPSAVELGGERCVAPRRDAERLRDPSQVRRAYRLADGQSGFGGVGRRLLRRHAADVGYPLHVAGARVGRPRQGFGVEPSGLLAYGAVRRRGVAGTLDRAGRERRPRRDVPPHVPCDETRGRGDRLCDRPRHLRGERQRAPCERRPSDTGLDGLQEAAAISGLRHHAAGGQGRQCHRRYRGQGVVVVETAVEPRVQLRRQVRPAGADRSPLQGRCEGGDRYRRHVARLDGRSELRQPLRRRDDRSEPSPEGVEHPVVRRCVVGFGAGGRHLAR